jgi:phage FluMu protein Com
MQETEDTRFNYETSLRPRVFLQWKNAYACFDFYCSCGTNSHFDGYFAHTVKCPDCKTVWEMPFNLFPREANEHTLDYHRENPKMLVVEEDEG